MADFPYIPPFDDEWIEMYLQQIYAGAVTPQNLSVEYHIRVGVELEAAMIAGFGTFESQIVGSEAYDLWLRMRSNVWQFSAAKQYQQVRAMSEFINNNGVKSTFAEFKKLANQVFDEYNVNYLKTEYNTAVGQSQMAREWVEAYTKKDIIPYLTYRTQQDGKVRDEHAILDGVTRKVDDPFWNTYMPKNGWNCRCFTLSVSRAVETDLSTLDSKVLKDETKFPKEFRKNVGKTGEIYDKKHPYFSVAKGDKALKDNNFGLGIP